MWAPIGKLYLTEIKYNTFKTSKHQNIIDVIKLTLNIRNRLWTSTTVLYDEQDCLYHHSSDAITSSKDLKYGLHADSTILWALHVCPSQAKVTSVKLFSSRRCLNEETMLDWKSFHFRKNCCWSAAIVISGLEQPNKLLKSLLQYCILEYLRPCW